MNLMNTRKVRIIMTVKRKILLIAGLIILAAVTLVLCVGYFTSDNSSEFDGTLVKVYDEFPTVA